MHYIDNTKIYCLNNNIVWPKTKRGGKLNRLKAIVVVTYALSITNINEKINIVESPMNMTTKFVPIFKFKCTANWCGTLSSLFKH